MPAACTITKIPYGGDLHVTVNTIRDLLKAGVIRATETPGLFELADGMDSQLWVILRHR